MLHPIDNFLNSITMYRLVCLGLLVLWGIALVLSVLGLITFPWWSLLVSGFLLLAVCRLTNIALAYLYKAPTNFESSAITALILLFIFTPLATVADAGTLLLAGMIAMASKYVLALNAKHLFNPAALAAVVLGLAGSTSPVWWVGSAVLTPFVVVFGFLIVRKIRRFDLVLSFLAAALMVMIFFGLKNEQPVLETLAQAITSWPLIFFATVMLTEPLTTPPTRKLRMIYGALVGALFSSQFNLGPIYPTPELALLIGNVFSYLVSPQVKLFLRLKEKVELAPNLYEFVFASARQPEFKPGQYLEWTLPHHHADSRGSRRYFTIASSPTEDGLKLGVRFNEPSSSFKQTLRLMKPGDELSATQLAGDFTLPADPREKLVFIAGGIGITPFRSMIQYLLDTKEKRDIVLFYASSLPTEFVYTDIFAKAEKALDLKMLYVVSKENAPKNWSGKVGRITEEMIREVVPDFDERKFYLSGPNAMVNGYRQLLVALKVPKNKIVTDYFPGF